ncbi:lipase family protein [Bacillus timonensis]|nr:lipase family protein [Bacillus timonensis]
MPNQVSYNKKLALKLMVISELTTYQRTHSKLPIPLGFNLVKEFTANAVGHREKFGFILQSKNAVVIGFRGSDTKYDWIADSEVAQVPFLGGQVHRGFYSIYDSCRQQIMDAYRDKLDHTKDKTLYITGHSLGAGLATLHALDVKLSDIGFKRVVMYNFASPRVGNQQFAAIYNANVRESVRFVNSDDIVPNLPRKNTERGRRNWTYQHVSAGVKFTLIPRIPGIAYNHSFTAYRKGIKHLP